eukprot:TRINITY_DN9359_c0_g1_i1.p3 TRINITY_DN9359_c0_g1~~TRINITY_DN9359_c0_g1_i1.p3  ORF type:complete len:218 (+),score=-19.42 TRINITY_DN9359_c0_g1_i1:105-758(+)
MPKSFQTQNRSETFRCLHSSSWYYHKCYKLSCYMCKEVYFCIVSKNKSIIFVQNGTKFNFSRFFNTQYIFYEQIQLDTIQICKIYKINQLYYIVHQLYSIPQLRYGQENIKRPCRLDDNCFNLFSKLRAFVCTWNNLLFKKVVWMNKMLGWVIKQKNTMIQNTHSICIIGIVFINSCKFVVCLCFLSRLYYLQQKISFAARKSCQYKKNIPQKLGIN